MAAARYCVIVVQVDNQLGRMAADYRAVFWGTAWAHGRCLPVMSSIATGLTLEVWWELFYSVAIKLSS